MYRIIRAQDDLEVLDPDFEVLTDGSALAAVGVTGIHPGLSEPNDEFSQTISPSGKMVISKLNRQGHADRTVVTHRRKDGSRGKSVGYLMEP